MNYYNDREDVKKDVEEFIEKHKKKVEERKALTKRMKSLHIRIPLYKKKEKKDPQTKITDFMED